MNNYRRYILLGLSGLILYFFLFFNLIKRVEQNNKKLFSAQEKLSLYLQGESLNNYYLSLEKYLSKRLESYTKFKNVSEGVTFLLSLIDSFNLDTKSIFHSTVRNTENISYITVDLELLGKYSDLCLFLHKLNSEAFRIEKIRITRSATSGISASLRLRLFLTDNVNK